ncbi:hypothetical protein V6N12_014261 [Hibiscus sabdariffa]|uniref:DUF4283 domain-containing protein n=1 Tax=Hibiscus sabdariffa TaxID=183260 RepID=A0ABR2DJM4_9ROSI
MSTMLKEHTIKTFSLDFIFVEGDLHGNIDKSNYRQNNLAPPTDSVLTASHDATGISVVVVSALSSLERPGSPVATIDQQAAKRGKAYVLVLDVDGSNSMDVDDQVLESTDGLHHAARVESMDYSSGSPKISYARIVAGANTLTVVEPSPSLDDVIVNADDVKVDMSGLFSSVDFSEQVHDRIDHNMCRSLIVRLLGRSIAYKTLMGRIQVLWQPKGAFQLVDLANDYFLVMFENEYDYEHVLEGHPWTVFRSYLNATATSEGHTESVCVEKEVYGPCMLVFSRRRQPHKETNHSKGHSSIPSFCGGSRFAILEDNVDKELAPSGDRVDLVSADHSRDAAL